MLVRVTMAFAILVKTSSNLVAARKGYKKVYRANP